MQHAPRQHVGHRIVAAARQALRRGVVDLTAASGLALALGFLQNLVLARVLGPEGLGHLSVLNTVLNLGGLAATAGVTTAVLRYSSAEADPAAAWTIFLRGVRLTAWVSVGVLLALALWARSPLWIFDPVAALWLPLAALVLPVRSVASCVTEFAQSRERLRAKALLEIAAKLLLVATSVGGAVAAGFAGTVYGFVAGTLLGGAACIAFVRTLRPRAAAPAAVSAREMLRFGLWGLLTNLLGLVLSTADVLCLSALVPDPSVVGFYSIAVVFQQIVRVPLVAYLDARFPEMTRTSRDPAALFALRRRMRGHLLLVAAPSCAAVAALAPWLIPLLFGDAYAASVRPLQILLGGHLALVLAAPQGRALLAAGNVEANFRASLLAALVNVPLNLALIPVLGGEGAALANVTSQALWAGATAWLCRRHEARLRR